MRRIPALIISTLLAACATGPKPNPLPAGVTFNGRWSSTFQQMVLHQEGKHVWGTVEYNEGSLEGTVEGDLLRFRWTQRKNQQSGHGYLQISADGQHLQGRWGYDADTEGGGEWTADKSGAIPVSSETSEPAP